MNKDTARTLFESGRSHALSSDLLYRAAIDEGDRRNVADPELFAFNGPYSLSINALLGLGLELMLKAAILASDIDVNDEFLRKEIGHDLIKALDKAEDVGFRSQAPNLRQIVEVMHPPYKAHWFRYERPEQFELPGDFVQIVEALKTLDEELQAKFWGEEQPDTAP